MVVVTIASLSACGESGASQTPSSWRAMPNPPPRAIFFGGDFVELDHTSDLGRRRCAVGLASDGSLFVGTTPLGAVSRATLQEMADQARVALADPRVASDVGYLRITAPDAMTYGSVRPVIERLRAAKIVAEIELALLPREIGP
jgi:hypothetical protein